MGIELRYEGRRVEVASGETVLEALERSDVSISSSCRAGVCQSCIVRVVKGVVPPGSQDGLKDSLKQSGHFLACVGRPQDSLVCESADSAPFRGATAIEEVRAIGPDIALVRLQRPANFSFSAGQFVTLRRDDGLARSYSIASRADDASGFDIHVRRIPGGRMSTWLNVEARPGDRLWVEGPKGDCTYQPGNPGEPLSLIGSGTGMAPLFAIVDDALRCGHIGPITIYQGGISEEQLYLVEDFSGLAARAPNVRYVRSVLHGPTSPEVFVGDLKHLVSSQLTDPSTRRAYLCGDPGLVRDLKKRLFLARVSMRRIHADPFLGTQVVS